MTTTTTTTKAQHHKFLFLSGSTFFLLLLCLLLATSGSNATTTSTNIDIDENSKNNNNNKNNDNNDNNNSNQLGRLLAQLFIVSSSSEEEETTTTKTGLLRRLENNISNDAEPPNTKIESSSSSNDNNNNNNNDNINNQFGPGADWSCTSTIEGAKINDFESCTTKQNLAEEGGGVTGGSSCSWCPLGSDTRTGVGVGVGVCLRAEQAQLVNGLETISQLLHLHCYDKVGDDAYIEQDKEAAPFWDEAVACHQHDAGECSGTGTGTAGGDHDHDHDHGSCTWCTVDEPAMGMCLSQTLWENLVVAQALEEFDKDVSTSDQIRLDQVIHCTSSNHNYNHGDHDNDNDNDNDDNDDNDNDNDNADNDNVSTGAGSNIVHSVWSTKDCGGFTELKTNQDEADCLATIKGQECVVQVNPFPGLLMGSKKGKQCVSLQQQRAILWAIELLRGMGWETTEMN